MERNSMFFGTWYVVGAQPYGPEDHDEIFWRHLDLDIARRGEVKFCSQFPVYPLRYPTLAALKGEKKKRSQGGIREVEGDDRSRTVKRGGADLGNIANGAVVTRAGSVLRPLQFPKLSLLLLVTPFPPSRPQDLIISCRG